MTFWNVAEAAALGSFLGVLCGVLCGNLLLFWWRGRAKKNERDLL